MKTILTLMVAMFLYDVVIATIGVLLERPKDEQAKQKTRNRKSFEEKLKEKINEQTSKKNRRPQSAPGN